MLHDFRINGKQTRLIQTGQDREAHRPVQEEGQVPYLCTVPGHAAAGMQGSSQCADCTRPPPRRSRDVALSAERVNGDRSQPNWA